MEIRSADPREADRLSHIARTAKARWGYPAAWMDAWRDFFTIRPEQIAANSYYVAQPPGGQLVGFCGVHRDGTDWCLEHLWVLPEWHGRDLGRQLFGRAADFVREQGGDALLIHADPNAEGFYLRMGAVRIGEVDATMDGISRVLPVLCHAIV